MVSCAMSTPPERTAQPGVVITHPNRDKPVVQATRATVILLMLATAALMAIVPVGGWKVLPAAKPVEIAYVPIYLTRAFLAIRSNRAVLPMPSVVAVLAGI